MLEVLQKKKKQQFVDWKQILIMNKTLLGFGLIILGPLGLMEIVIF